jgi:hypothetical protein
VTVQNRLHTHIHMRLPIERHHTVPCKVLSFEWTDHPRLSLCTSVPCVSDITFRRDAMHLSNINGSKLAQDTALDVIVWYGSKLDTRSRAFLWTMTRIDMSGSLSCVTLQPPKPAD